MKRDRRRPRHRLRRRRRPHRRGRRARAASSTATSCSRCSRATCSRACRAREIIFDVKCSQGLDRGHRRARRQAVDVEDRPLADQEPACTRPGRRSPARCRGTCSSARATSASTTRCSRPAGCCATSRPSGKTLGELVDSIPQLLRHARDPARVPRGPQVRRWSRTLTQQFAEQLPGDRHRRRARRVRRRLGAGARLEHAAGARGALRGADARAARGDPRRCSWSRCGGSGSVRRRSATERGRVATRTALGRPLPRALLRAAACSRSRAPCSGGMLVHDAPDGAVAGRIVEVEAYRGARRSREPRVPRAHRAQRGRCSAPPGHAYVYFTYGMHHCLNLVDRAGGPRRGGAGARARAGRGARADGARAAARRAARAAGARAGLRRRGRSGSIARARRARPGRAARCGSRTQPPSGRAIAVVAGTADRHPAWRRAAVALLPARASLRLRAP